jgi:hypothetical protein
VQQDGRPGSGERCAGRGGGGVRPPDEPRLLIRSSLTAEKRVMVGNPDESKISTSYAERQNLTMRMGCKPAGPTNVVRGVFPVRRGAAQSLSG